MYGSVLGILRWTPLWEKTAKGAILTINDRATGVLKMKKLNGKNASELAEACISALSHWVPNLMTITADNGKEEATRT